MSCYHLVISNLVVATPCCVPPRPVHHVHTRRRDRHGQHGHPVCGCSLTSTFVPACPGSSLGLCLQPSTDGWLHGYLPEPSCFAFLLLGPCITSVRHPNEHTFSNVPDIKVMFSTSWCHFFPDVGSILSTRVSVIMVSSCRPLLVKNCSIRKRPSCSHQQLFGTSLDCNVKT